jgi:hypothetical protein
LSDADILASVPLYLVGSLVSVKVSAKTGYLLTWSDLKCDQDELTSTMQSASTAARPWLQHRWLQAWLHAATIKGLGAGSVAKARLPVGLPWKPGGLTGGDRGTQ